MPTNPVDPSHGRPPSSHLQDLGAFGRPLGPLKLALGLLLCLGSVAAALAAFDADRTLDPAARLALAWAAIMLLASGLGQALLVRRWAVDLLRRDVWEGWGIAYCQFWRCYPASQIDSVEARLISHQIQRDVFEDESSTTRYDAHDIYVAYLIVRPPSEPPLHLRLAAFHERVKLLAELKAASRLLGRPLRDRSESVQHAPRGHSFRVGLFLGLLLGAAAISVLLWFAVAGLPA
ncbi:hypothetical protein [Paucibacter sp. XJ19-41]|uniref:hypothetical protein n=1 Tax=Paucibacter sp. XJ19-41 TaxID=2927824 RepID=UPI0023490B30|nr:hypothetical protein [Paucibacter sp. XJ19-41]MDC6170596.1 hypothetical protein [Paucibacter sp. XJ19-41]